jgi:branched-chain amino acid transport system substrate-binding protein
LAALLCAAFLTSGVGGAADPVRIDAILPLTGPAAFLGSGEAEALRILQGVVNKQGGINGRPIEFAISDDTSNPATALQLITQAAARKAAVVIGPSSTASCNATTPYAVEHGPVSYCLSNGIHPPAGSYVFTMWVTVDALNATALRYLQSRKLTKIAFMTSTDATGQEQERALNENLQRPEFKNIEIVTREHFGVSDISVAAQMTRIKASGAQAAMLLTAGTGFGTMLRGAKDVGLDMPIVGGSGTMVRAQLAQYKDFIPKDLLFVGTRAVAEGGVRRGPQVAYFAAYKAAAKQPDLPGSLAWDPALMVIEAMRKVGPDASADRVRDYLEGLKGWSGIHGTYDFTDRALPQRGLGEGVCIVVRYDPQKEDFVYVSAPGGAAR